MARPVSITKGKILAAALDVVRKGGASALTARSLSTALGCGANAIFSAYGSMEGVLSAVKSEARRLFRERIGAGFSLNPPFKGFGLALLWFAMDEPQLYKIVIEEKVSAMSIEDYIDAHIGFKVESVAAISQSFGLQEKDAEMLYYQMVIVALGIAHICVEGSVPLSMTQASEIFGKNVRAFLMVIHAGVDARESFIPQKGPGPEGDVDSYLLMHTLTGQNHLLQELHANPRYIQDSEWVEMERVLRNSFSLTPESLREEHPNLTRGDVRLLILSRLQFSVTEQALLLGISPASVTKARQRLKNKIGAGDSCFAVARDKQK
jgi:AcrR family transcriptional regulator